MSPRYPSPAATPSSILTRVNLPPVDHGIDRRSLLTGLGRAAALAGVARVVAGPVARTVVEPAMRLVAAEAPRIITRAEWGADESRRRGRPEFHPVRKFVIHHTATGNGDRDPRGRLRSIYGSHLNRRSDDGDPWEDIGYNFVIDEQGRIYEGRRARRYASGEPHHGEDPFLRGVRGAHAGEWNRGSVGIAVIGTYSGRRPTDATVEAVSDLIAWKCARHGLDPTGVQAWTNSNGDTHLLPTIVGHRDVRSTSCPGDGIYALLGTIRRRTADKLASTSRGANLERSDAPGGYRILHGNGAITSLGHADDVGDLTRQGFDVRATALAPRPGATSRSFWVADRAGGVFAFSAPYYGSIPGLRQAGHRIGDADVMHIASTADADGYWVLDRAGGVFAFGDAPYHGSIPGLRQAGQRIGRADVIAVAPTLTGRGYWILDRAGGVFTFGDARYFGSVPALRNAGHEIGDVDAVDLRPSPGGRGYWVLDAAGGVFSFGDAPYFGSIPGTGFPAGARARRLVPTAGGDGYLVLTDDGGILAFGTAVWHGHGPLHASVDLMVTG